MTLPAEAGRSTGDAQRSSDPRLTFPRGESFSDLLTAASARKDVSDRSFRIYATIVTTLIDAPFDVETATTLLPDMTAKQVGQHLGDLARAGLLTSRRKTVAYREGKAVVRTYYRVVTDGAA